MASPLVETKLFTSRLRRGAVSRPRLSSRLRQGAEAKLTDIGPRRLRQDHGSCCLAGRAGGDRALGERGSVRGVGAISGAAPVAPLSAERDRECTESRAGTGFPAYLRRTTHPTTVLRGS